MATPFAVFYSYNNDQVLEDTILAATDHE